MTLALKKYILQGEIIQFPSNEGITDMKLSVLCTWERSFIHSLLGRALLNTPWISKQKIFCNVKKKGNDGQKKRSAATCCCVLRREPPICAKRLSSEATKETCSRTPVSWREQFVRSILSVQRCSSHVYMQGRAQDPYCSRRTPQRATMCFRMWRHAKNLMKS